MLKKKKTRWLFPFSKMIRVDGFPVLSAVASVAAFTSISFCASAFVACSNHFWNCAIGFASKSARRNPAKVYSRLMSAIFILHGTKCRQTQKQDKQGKRESNRAADFYARFRRRRPIQEIAQFPRRDREPDSGDDQNVSPDLNHQNPRRFAKIRTARVQHQFCEQQKNDGQSAHGQKILDENARQNPDGGERGHHVRFERRKIRDRLLIDDPQKPCRAEQHQKDAGGQVARKFADARRELLWINDSVNLRRGKTEAEQDGQKRQFHFRKLTTN